MLNKFPIGVLSLCLLYLSFINHAYSAPTVKEYHVKATFTQTFTNFIKWPENTIFNSTQQPLQLCVIGENTFNKTLDLLVNRYNADIKAKEHPQAVNYISRNKDFSHCHLVYISKSEQDYFHHILSELKGKPVLTVSSIKEFVLSGGMIQFYVRDNKVRFLIDPQTIRDNQLQANANFLRVADIIGE